MSLKTFQTRIGAVPDGDFGPKTLVKARDFLKLTNEQAAHFFGQVSHETGHFAVFEENLNYSKEGLKKIFGKYFKTDSEASNYARKPEKIANKVYANRMGNGDEASGDGWKYKGRGALQLTGKSNYKAFALHVGDCYIESNPDVVADKYAFNSALFFFERNKLWDLCKTVSDTSIYSVTKKINGGTNSLADRTMLTKKYYSWLK